MNPATSGPAPDPGRLTVIGVRHHSPACAGLVRRTIAALRPACVLIEGPVDFNPHLPDLALGHDLPVAIFSFRADAAGSAASYTPFCAFSPEWQALEAGRAVGAQTLFCDLPAWDPAFGREGAQGDGSVLACAYADAEGNHYLHRISWITQRADLPADPATQQCQAVAQLAREHHLPVIRVETNGLGRFLPAMLRRELARAGAACAVVEHTSRRAKSERILSAFDPLLAARQLHAHDSVFRTPFAREMAEWRPEAKGARDDALDAASGAILAEPVRLPGLPARIAPSWRCA